MESLERVKSLIENEPPEILRALVLTTYQEVERLHGVIKTIENEKARQKQIHLNIEEQVKLLRRKIFARSKEDRKSKGDSEKEDKRESQTEAELFAQAAFPAPEEPKSQKEKWAVIPETEISHDLSAEELKAESVLRGIASLALLLEPAIAGAAGAALRCEELDDDGLGA